MMIIISVLRISIEKQEAYNNRTLGKSPGMASQIMACSPKMLIWEIWKTLILMEVCFQDLKASRSQLRHQGSSSKNCFWMILRATRKSVKKVAKTPGKKLRFRASGCRDSSTARANTKRYLTWCWATINSSRGLSSTSKNSGCSYTSPFTDRCWRANYSLTGNGKTCFTNVSLKTGTFSTS